MNEGDYMFRAYLRGLLRHPNAIKAVPQKRDFAVAEQFVDEPLEDTKQGKAETLPRRQCHL